MALTVEELQIVLSCDATTAQAVLDKMEATVKAYTDKFQKYFNNMGGKKNVSVPSLDTVVKDVEKQTKKLAKAGADWKKQYEKTFGETYEESAAKMYRNTGEYKPSGKRYIESESWARHERGNATNGVRLVNQGAGAGPQPMVSQWLDKAKAGMSGFSRAVMEKLGPLKTQLGEVFQGAGPKITAALSSAGGAVASFAMKATNWLSEMGNVASWVGSRIGKVLMLPFRAFGGLLKKLVGPSSLMGKFISRLKTVALRMAAMKLIRGTIQGAKEGLEQLAKTSTSSAKAMNTIKAASGSIKMALGAALMPIVKALAPLFVSLAGAISTAANALARFFAVVTGQSSYTAVNFSSNLDNIASSAGGAGKAVKGMLADFDEINLITSQGGGGGGGGTGVEQSLSTVSDLTAVSELGSRIRQSIESGDWTDAGAALAEKLGELSNKFTEWVDGLKTLNIGKKVATFLNGVFSKPGIFSDAGASLGNALGFITTEIINFFKNIDIESIFLSCASFFTGFASAFFKNLKDVFPEGSFLDNIFEGLYSAFDSLKNLFTDSLEWKRFKTQWALVWNDLKLSALEAWNGILRAFEGNALAEKLFGVSAALEKNEQNLAETKEKASDLELEYNVLTKTLAENKGKTDDAAKATEGLSYQASYAVNTTRDLQGSLDKLGETNVEPQVNPKVGETIETNDLFSDRPISHGKKIGEGSAKIDVGLDSKIDKTVDSTDVFSNKAGVIHSPTGMVIGLGMRPQVEGPIKSTDLVANSSGVTQDNNGLGISFKVKPEVEGGNTTVTALQSIITGFNDISGKAKKATLSVKMSGAKESAVTKMSNAVSKFFDGSKTSTITINQSGSSMEQIQNAANAIKNFPKSVTVQATVDVVNTAALKKALQDALTASATITVNGKKAGSFKVNANNVQTMASGGIAYGITSAIIGEYAGASSNPEVVAPLSKLQGILESSGTVSKDTMTRDQANTMIQLLQRIERKEIEVKPSVGLGQVVQQSLGAYART